MAIIVFSTKFGMGNRLIPKEIMKVMVLLGYLADVVAFVDEEVGEKEGEVTPSLMELRRRVASNVSSRTLTTT